MTTMMYGNGFGWGWMMLMPLLWIVLIGVIVWAAVMVARRPADRPAEQPRREILDRRFASGEIDADAYTQARACLAGREAASP
jgi:putative membrane protein